MITAASLYLFTCLAATPDVVGVAVSPGSFQIGGAPVVGTGSLHEGVPVKTVGSPSRLVLRSGATVEMDSHAVARVYQGKVVLESGRNRVSGPISVSNANGVLLAQLAPGRALDFIVSEMSSAIARISGTVEFHDDAYWMTDDLTHVSFKLSAKGDIAKALEAANGKKVEVEGRITNEVIEASKVTSTDVPPAPNPSVSASTTGTTATTAEAATAAGISTKAIIAGVVIAAAGAGTAIAVTQSSSSQTISQ